ncbi:MAG: hypothetical protein ABI867_28365 [Kofleriaceae bacterium]
MRSAAVGIVVGVAACWTAAAPDVPAPAPKPTMTTSKAAPTEYRATLRIDAQPGGKKFQGVWLDFGGAKRWVLDYRTNDLWESFQDAEVRVTGHCYEPFGQAIQAVHFEVDTLTFASAPKMAVPYFAIGPKRLYRGSFIATTAPPGSKLAGTVTTKFQVTSGKAYAMASSLDVHGRSGAAAITARELEINLAYTATTGDPRVWVIAVHDADYVPSDRDTPKPCP